MYVIPLDVMEQTITDSQFGENQGNALIQYCFGNL